MTCDHHSLKIQASFPPDYFFGLSLFNQWRQKKFEKWVNISRLNNQVVYRP